MATRSDQLTFASHVPVCAQCRAEISFITAGNSDDAVNWPCGHSATITLTPNPLLSESD